MKRFVGNVPDKFEGFLLLEGFGFEKESMGQLLDHLSGDCTFHKIEDKFRQVKDAGLLQSKSLSELSVRNGDTKE